MCIGSLFRVLRRSGVIGEYHEGALFCRSTRAAASRLSAATSQLPAPGRFVGGCLPDPDLLGRGSRVDSETRECQCQCQCCQSSGSAGFQPPVTQLTELSVQRGSCSLLSASFRAQGYNLAMMWAGNRTGLQSRADKPVPINSHMTDRPEHHFSAAEILASSSINAYMPAYGPRANRR